ncbi:related to DAD1 - essential subunit of the Dam1 complex [Melanopsichium pennsylvanicum]|uniref:DASH complex subunit DAD1 n=1 Tax=Melanopsichium pennsylvanicum TaxID=63383 RepID=A0AAJ5C7A0_9BASI|nr:related to DAD1 - essential subunit of the Dam1 complex [Melanopsichium pennsylvanicum]
MSSSSVNNTGAGVGGGVGNDIGFFERERNRLIGDISKGVESILGNSNVLNRKLEESISVGKEFHPISQLWSKFETIMFASGIPNLHPQNQNSPNTNVDLQEQHHLTSSGNVINHVGDGNRGIAAVEIHHNDKIQQTQTHRESQDQDQDEGEGGAGGRIRFETKVQSLPPGVAPGGGRIYA